MNNVIELPPNFHGEPKVKPSLSFLSRQKQSENKYQ